MNTDVGAGSQISLTINDMIHKPALFVSLCFLWVGEMNADERR